MPEIDEILNRFDRLDDKVDCIDRKLATMKGEQSVRCEDHGRRLIKLELRRPTNGNGAGTISSKALVALCGAIAVLCSIIATLVERLL